MFEKILHKRSYTNGKKKKRKVNINGMGMCKLKS